MLETNQPLHAFDFEKISGQTIMVRFAKNGEKLLTLDDKTYELEGDILVIADGEKPLAIAGIKGGQSSGINPKTKTIVLEAANFNHLTIRRASQKLKLKTDASWRFEHGLDANLTQIGLNQAAAIINQVAGGQVAQGLVDFYPRRRRPKIIKLAMGLVNDLLGVKIPVVRAKAILRSLDFKTKPSRKYLLVQPPTIRTDALLPEDLVEEIGRFYGYQNIVERFPEVRLSPPLENRDLFWGEKARDLMVQADFAEVWNYSFARKGELELENPLDQNRPYLVSSLWPNLLNNVALNSPYFEKGKIFELGKVFLKKGEERRLAAAIWGKGSQGFWELKGAAESLLEKSGVGKFKWRENVRNNFEIIVERTPVGVLQEQDAVWLLEINFEKLLPWFSRNKEYQPLAKNPAAKRDLAILVPEKTRSAGVEKIVSAQKIPYLSKIELFDVYRGPKLPPGKKGLAFHFFFQSLEKTLTAEEVNMSLEKIINILEKKEWRVRK
jgi:phenylalanyl-tRNA synthetase beta chain